MGDLIPGLEQNYKIVSNKEWIEKTYPEIVILNNQIPGILPLSFSKIMAGLTCPAKFKNRYLEKIKLSDEKLRIVPPTKVSGVAIGNFLHKVMECCVEKCNLYGWTKEILDFDLVWTQVSRSAGLTLGEYNFVQEVRNETEQLINQIAMLRKKLNLTYYPECRCEVNTSGAMYGSVVRNKKLLTMKVDLFGVNQEDKSGILIDYKSYANGAHDESETIKQLQFYGVHLLDFFKINTIKIGIGYIPSGKFEKIGTIQRAEASQYHNIVSELYADFLEVIYSGNYPYKVNEYCKYCDLIEYCPEIDEKTIKKLCNS
jgi:hypothetical protein